METAETDEKFATIRQTIRRVILPLVQSIYDEDPPDVELFCFQFFESQLRKRESEERDGVDGDFKRIEAFHEKNRVDKYNVEIADGSDKTTSSTSNIQGSASDPVLTGEKSHGVSLRETSSWDITPNHSKKDGRRTDLICDLSDVKWGVGDQLCHEETPEADPKIDRKAGDEYFFPKGEDTILENEDILLSDEAVKVSDVLPSAPPYKDPNLKLENNKRRFDNPENSDQEIEIILEKNNPTQNETNFISHTVSDDESCSYSDKCTVVKGFKISSKSLSPNSSFGFIPHLNETCVKQESPKIFDHPKSSKDSNVEKRTDGEAFDLAGQFSETLQDLAQKFNSAETNLDVEFQKAKEISDVMHGRSLGEDFKGDNNLNLNAAKKDESTGERNYKSPSVEIDSYIDVEENTDISSIRNALESSFEPQRDDNSSISLYVKESKEKFETDQHGNKSGSSKIQAEATEVDINEEAPELCRKNYSFTQQKHLNYDKSRTNSAIVDEEWRKRWYEAHPCLDNSNNRLRQTPPRISAENQVYISAPNNPTLNPIGEAGDVPPDLFRHTSESNVARNFRHLESNSRVERNVSFSPILEEHHSQEKISPDEIQRRENTKETFNNLDKNGTRTKMSSSCSSNIPYAWRKMSKNQARYLETEKQVLKQLLESCGEGAASKEKKSIENAKATHTQALHDSLSEIVVDKQQANKSIYVKKANNESETIRNNELKDCEEKSNKQNFNDNSHKKLQSPLLVKNNLSLADRPEGINLQVSNINDKNVKSFKTLSEDDCDTFETKEKPCYEERKNTVSENQNDQEREKCFDTYSTSEKDKILHRNDGAKNVDICKNKTPKLASNEDLISDVKDEIRAYQRIDNFSKAEPGLDSAGGDFTSPNINENEELVSSPEYFGHNASPGLQEVTVEYVGELIERMIQQDSLSDSYEGLNFSSYSDNDSSDMESEYSDAEDSNLYAEMYEQ